MRFTVRRLMIAIAIISLISAGIVELARLRRDKEIQRALVQSLQPPESWPTGWREELNTSLTVEGQVTFGGKAVNDGTISFILMPEGRLFNARINKGKYSMKRDRMPTGSYRIEVKSLDGSEPRTIKGPWELPMDQGFHRLNLTF